MAVVAQSEVRIILAQQQTVLRPAGHHAVRLVIFLIHQIVDQHAYIGFRTVQYKRLPAPYHICGIYAGHQSLGRSFFVAAAAVELSGAEHALYGL